MNRLVSLAAGAAFSTLLIVGLSNPAFAPADMFLKIDGIDGEASDAAHKDEIDVLSWSWGESSSTRATPGERLMQPKMGAGELTVVKMVDRSSPKLQQACNSGKHLKSVGVFEGSRAYTLYDVRLRCSATAGASDDRPTEEVAFYYSKIKFSYKKQKKDRDERKKKDRDG